MFLRKKHLCGVSFMLLIVSLNSTEVAWWLPVHTLALCRLLITAANRILWVIGVRITFHRWGWNATLGNVLCFIYEFSSFIFFIYLKNAKEKCLPLEMSSVWLFFYFFLTSPFFLISEQIMIWMYFTWQHLSVLDGAPRWANEAPSEDIYSLALQIWKWQ